MYSDGDTAQITLTFNGFGEGEAVPTSALLRPSRILFRESKKIGKLTFQFFRKDEGSSMKVFGSFCMSPGGRLLFFPGLTKKKILWCSKTNSLVLPRGFIDHISVEPDFKTWHVTTLVNGEKEKKPWLKGFPLKELEPKLFLWFGLSIRKDDILEQAPKVVKWTSSEGYLRAEKFAQNVVSSRERSVFNILQLPNYYKTENSKDSFLHFDVFIDQRNDISGDFKYKTIAPFSKPILVENVRIKQKMVVRGHDVTIPDFKGIIRIGVFQRSGILSEEAVFSNLDTSVTSKMEKIKLHK